MSAGCRHMAPPNRFSRIYEAMSKARNTLGGMLPHRTNHIVLKFLCPLFDGTGGGLLHPQVEQLLSWRMKSSVFVHLRTVSRLILQTMRYHESHALCIWCNILLFGMFVNRVVRASRLEKLAYTLWSIFSVAETCLYLSVSVERTCGT